MKGWKNPKRRKEKETRSYNASLDFEIGSRNSIL